MTEIGVLLLSWGVLEGSVYLLRPGSMIETLVRIAFGLGTAFLILRKAREI